MKFRTSSTDLASRLSALSKVLSGKNTLPILNCFLFDVKEGGLTITASDGDNVMVMPLAIYECEGEGTFAIVSDTILEAVRELPEQPLAVEVDMETFAIRVTYQNGTYNFTGQGGDEFPPMTMVDSPLASLTIDSRILAGDISRAIFATAQTVEVRPAMAGICFDLRQDHLAVVACDGHKLVRTRNYAIQTDPPTSFVLPRKPATLLKGVLPKASEQVVVTFDGANANVEFGEGMLSCRLMDSRYPNYNSVVPADNPCSLSVERSMMLSAVRRVLPFANSSSQQVRLKIETGLITMTSEDMDFNTSARETVECDYVGNAVSIGFKGSSLIEILSNLESERVSMDFSDPSRPCLIHPTESPEDEDVLMLIMPMLLND